MNILYITAEILVACTFLDPFTITGTYWQIQDKRISSPHLSPYGWSHFCLGNMNIFNFMKFLLFKGMFWNAAGLFLFIIYFIQFCFFSRHIGQVVKTTCSFYGQSHVQWSSKHKIYHRKARDIPEQNIRRQNWNHVFFFDDIITDFKTNSATYNTRSF